MNKISALLIGLGRAGHIHMQTISQLPNIEVKYVYDFNLELSEKVAANTSCISVSNLDAALEDPELKAVIISSPTASHFDYILQSLNAGKHVFTEKPLGKSIAEINECYDRAERSGLSLFLGFQRRVDVNFKSLKENLNQLGKCQFVIATSRDNPKPSYSYLDISGNIFHDMVIHDFDMMINLFGVKIPKTVYATAYAHDPKIAKNKDFDIAQVSLSFKDGLIYTINTSRISSYGYDQRLELFGEHGMLKVENKPKTTLRIYSAEEISHSIYDHSFPERYADAYFNEMKLFVTEILNGQSIVNVTREECILSHLLADAAYHSARSQRAIDFRDFIKPHL